MKKYTQGVEDVQRVLDHIKSKQYKPDTRKGGDPMTGGKKDKPDEVDNDLEEDEDGDSK